MSEAKKKVLLVTADRTISITDYIVRALEEKNYDVVSINCLSSTDLPERMQHIQDHGSEYAAAIMMHGGTFARMRAREEDMNTGNADKIPAMLEWLTEAKQHMPNARMLVLDSEAGLGSLTWNALQRIGCLMCDNMEFTAFRIADLIDTPPQQDAGKKRARR